MTNTSLAVLPLHSAILNECRSLSGTALFNASRTFILQKLSFLLHHVHLSLLFISQSPKYQLVQSQQIASKSLFSETGSTKLDLRQLDLNIDFFSCVQVFKLHFVSITLHYCTYPENTSSFQKKKELKNLTV